MVVLDESLFLILVGSGKIPELRNDEKDDSKRILELIDNEAFTLLHSKMVLPRAVNFLQSSTMFTILRLEIKFQ